MASVGQWSKSEISDVKYRDMHASNPKVYMRAFPVHFMHPGYDNE